MTFEEWLASTDYTVWDNAEMTAEAAWNYQQAKIEALELMLAVRDAFIAGMTYPKVSITDDEGNVRLQTDDFGNVSIGTAQEGE